MQGAKSILLKAHAKLMDAHASPAMWLQIVASVIQKITFLKLKMEAAKVSSDYVT